MKRIKDDELPDDETSILKDIQKNPKKYNEYCLSCIKNCKQLSFCKIARCQSYEEKK